MKHELLRIQNLEKRYLSQQVFKNLSFNIYAGESAGLLIPPLSGKTTLAGILAGREDFSGTAFFCDEPVDHSFRKYNASGEIACILKGSRLFPELSVSENMFIATSRQSMLSHVNYAELRRKAKYYIDWFGIDADPDGKARSLDIFTQHLILLAGALYHNAKLLVFDDSFESYGEHNVEKLLGIARTICASGVSILWLSSGYSDIFRTLDRVIVIRDCQKVRTLYHPSEYSREDVQRLQDARQQAPSRILLSNLMFSRGPGSILDSPPALSLSGIKCGMLSGVNLVLAEGEALGIGSRDMVYLQAFSELFSGTEQPISGSALIRGKPVSCLGGLRGCGHDFFVVKDTFISDQLLDHFSLFDNIYIPVCSAHDASLFSTNFGLQKALQQEIESAFGLDADAQSRPIESFDLITRQNVVLFRLLLQHPAFIVYFSSFMQTDYQTQQLFIKYFKLYKQAGIGLLIVSQHLEPFRSLLSRTCELTPTGPAAAGLFPSED